MTHKRTITFMLAAASFASAVIAVAPAAAKPVTPMRATSERGSGCFVTDANGTTTFEASCTFHLQSQTNSNGELISAMYQDHGQLPAGAVLPSSAIKRDISFDEVRCTERITPSGQYTSECYFQSRSQ